MILPKTKSVKVGRVRLGSLASCLVFGGIFRDEEWAVKQMLLFWSPGLVCVVVWLLFDTAAVQRVCYGIQGSLWRMNTSSLNILVQ